MRRLITVAVLILIPQWAHAGGFEFPDNGAQPLSRGGAFTAKADDLTALQYNVAGLAWVRGTHVLIDSNFVMANYEFARAGNYPENTQNPHFYDGMPFPKVSSDGPLRVAPFAGVASDFGMENMAVAVGAYGPSGYGRFNFGSTIHTAQGDLPAPQRYDLVDQELLVVQPTFAVAWRLLPYLSIGAAYHLVYSTQQYTTTAYLPAPICGIEDPRCDYRSHIDVAGFSNSFSVGAMLRLGDSWQLGVNYRHSTPLDDTGTVKASFADNAPTHPTYDDGRTDADVLLQHSLPRYLRSGVRHVWREDGFERADLELDFTYEGWSDEEEFVVKVSHLTPTPLPLHVLIHYDDTFSLRLGGAYNFDLKSGVLSLRAGGYYDSPAQPDAYTRLNFQAREHIGMAAGLGYNMGWLSFDLGAAYIYIPSRTVDDSRIKQLHSLGAFSDPALTTVGNGEFSGSNFVATAGVQLHFDPFR
jgi:long-chain fatty acid transport protein